MKKFSRTIKNILVLCQNLWHKIVKIKLCDIIQVKKETYRIELQGSPDG